MLRIVFSIGRRTNFAGKLHLSRQLGPAPCSPFSVPPPVKDTAAEGAHLAAASATDTSGSSVTDGVERMANGKVRAATAASQGETPPRHHPGA